MSIEEQQAALMPKEDLRSYAGQWVALRDGWVIDHAVDAHDLESWFGRPDVMVMPVPYPGLYV